MPRFVILRHTVPDDSPRGEHWDLMFEVSGVLRTWAVNSLPTENQTIAALRLPDHRLAYLDYEGEVSGNRGSVTCCDRGQFDVMEDLPNRFVVTIRGETLAGQFTIELSDGNDNWKITCQFAAIG